MKKVDILKKLRSSGLRPTKQRVEIAKFLFEREKTFHFTVESLDNLLAKILLKFSTVKWKVLSLSNKNFAISTLCLVGLKPEERNFFKMSVLFMFFWFFFIVYNHSKTKYI